jgi:hypothetical protein
MLEPEMEAFLLRLVPGLDDEWEGATDIEIAQIERLAGQPLPRFYRWLLSRVGGDHGPLPSFFAAFAARNVISAYAAGEYATGGPLFFIGRIDDPMMPLDIFYDLARRTRDDAFVVTHFTGDDPSEDAETLREWTAWLALSSLRINACAQRVSGSFEESTGDVAVQLATALAGLGFTSPVPTGPYCAVYERDDAALACKVEAEPDNTDLLTFDLGGPDVTSMRRILGEIATRGHLKVTISDWTPPLPK